MADLKKKFIDILFEEDPDEDELEEYTGRKIEKPVENKETGYSAKDILYRKPGGSAFINLQEEPKFSVEKDKEIEEAKQDYEMSSQISPIFGVLKESEKKNTYVRNSVDKSFTDKPDDSHLDIITSPIYGYGNGDVDDAIEENEEDQLHNLFDEKQTPETNNEDLDLFKLFGDK